MKVLPKHEKQNIPFLPAAEIRTSRTQGAENGKHFHVRKTHLSARSPTFFLFDSHIPENRSPCHHFYRRGRKNNISHLSGNIGEVEEKQGKTLPVFKEKERFPKPKGQLSRWERLAIASRNLSQYDRKPLPTRPKRYIKRIFIYIDSQKVHILANSESLAKLKADFLLNKRRGKS